MTFSRLLFGGALFLFLLVAAANFPCVAEASTAGCATRCHKSKVRESSVHTPVAADKCTLCHIPSGKEHPKEKGSFQLLDKGVALCYRCHDSKSNLAFVHSPVASGDCLACHDVHQTQYKGQLKSPGASLCFMCHDEKAFHGNDVHLPVKDGNCLGCHDPHQSRNRKLLKKSGSELCFICHNRRLAEGKSIHEPVTSGACLSCHSYHVSDNEKLLKKPMTEKFYLSYDEKNFEFCFECHNKELARDSRTDTITNFRNGDRNLHYLHINKPDKGRACKSCHQPHASSQEKLIKENVAGFGNWGIPIRYTKSSTGGTCVVGCHKPKEYDRLNPAAY